MSEVGKGKPPKDKQFKPGQSGNPAGRPKKLPELDQLLADVFGGDEMEQILRAMYTRALKGDTRAAEIILNRGYGKSQDKVDITTNGKDLPTSKEIVFRRYDAKP